jgi:hypothetical protein
MASRRRWSSFGRMRFLLISGDPVFRNQVVDGLLLSAIDPSGEEQEMPWLQKGFNFSECGYQRRSIRDQQDPVKRPKNDSCGLWQELSSQILAVRSSFFTTRA